MKILAFWIVLILAMVGLLCGEATAPVEVVDTKGRMIKGLPLEISGGMVVFLRESDKKRFLIDVGNLTPESRERCERYLREAKERVRVQKERNMVLSREGLSVHSVRFWHNDLLIYTKVKNCTVDLNGHKSGFGLLAPDRSSFSMRDLGWYKVSDTGALRERINIEIEDDLRGRTVEERKEILKRIEIADTTFGNWKGFSVSRADNPLTIQEYYLESGGRFFRFRHGCNAHGFDGRREGKVGALSIDRDEFARILETINFTPEKPASP